VATVWQSSHDGRTYLIQDEHDGNKSSEEKYGENGWKRFGKYSWVVGSDSENYRLLETEEKEEIDQTKPEFPLEDEKVDPYTWKCSY
jgi:hypothetical protein